MGNQLLNRGIRIELDCVLEWVSLKEVERGLNHAGVMLESFDFLCVDKSGLSFVLMTLDTNQTRQTHHLERGTWFY